MVLPSRCEFQILLKESQHRFISFSISSRFSKVAFEISLGQRRAHHLNYSILSSLVSQFSQRDFKRNAPATEGLMKVRIDFRVTHRFESLSETGDSSVPVPQTIRFSPKLRLRTWQIMINQLMKMSDFACLTCFCMHAFCPFVCLWASRPPYIFQCIITCAKQVMF